MRTHPLLNVDHVTPDPELVQKIPHAMALYYMALPLAGEDGQVSVAMAHPENTTAVGVLSKVLGSPVVAVRGVSDVIRAALHRLRTVPEQPEPTVIGWCIRSGADGLHAPVVSWTQWLGATLGARTRLLSTTQAAFDEGFSAFSKEPHWLIVLDSVPDPQRTEVLRQATGPLFLVRGQNHAPHSGAESAPMRRILVALRGYSSDEHALEWAAILAANTQATLTILPLTGRRVSALQSFRTVKDEAEGSSRMRLHPRCDDQHICVKVRQGAPVVQIADEAASGYDLLILAAEGEGAFVGQVLAELERRAVHEGRPAFILKPTL